MRNLFIAALATAVVGLAAPATAAVTLATNNGQLATHINSSTLANAPQDATVVWGSTLAGGDSHDVDFTGNTTLNISPGAGFASISDPDGVNGGDITELPPSHLSRIYTRLNVVVQIVDAKHIRFDCFVYWDGLIR